MIEPYVANVILAGGLVAALGSAAQRAELIAPLIEGKRKLAFAHDDRAPTKRDQARQRLCHLRRQDGRARGADGGCHSGFRRAAVRRHRRIRRAERNIGPDDPPLSHRRRRPRRRYRICRRRRSGVRPARRQRGCRRRDRRDHRARHRCSFLRRRRRHRCNGEARPSSTPRPACSSASRWRNSRCCRIAWST